MKRSFLPLAAMVLLASCTSETFNNPDAEMVSQVTITAKDYVMDDATRTALDLTDSGLSFTWAESDVVGIYPNAGDQVSFPMTAGAGTKSASFDGGGWALKGGYTYAAYFPYNVDNTTNGRSYTALPISYVGQKQPSNNSTAGLGAYDYMVATASTPESGIVTFNFEHIGSVLYIQLTAPEAATFTKLTLSADDPIFTTEATVNLSDGTLTPTSTSNSISLALDNIAVEAGSTLYAWMQIAPTDASSKTLTATMTTSETEIYTVELTGKTFEAGKAYQLKGTTQKEYIISGVEAGHAYVDLGLPSGTLWATTNVGADSPEEYGDYFAWGETKPKNEYSWNTYKWCNGSYDSLIKYNYNSSYGVVDDMTILNLQDDAATVNWGGSWRMPTDEEWYELLNSSNCSITWANQSGHFGYRITSLVNGNSIFLPAAGGYYGLSQSDSSIYGSYWSSSINEGGPHGARDVDFNKENVYQDSGIDIRCDGQSVRPVYRP